MVPIIPVISNEDDQGKRGHVSDSFCRYAWSIIRQLVSASS